METLIEKEQEIKINDYLENITIEELLRNLPEKN
jgi:hypothetical protein